MSKRVVFLADSISTQKAGIHYYGRQLIDSIMETFPEYEYFSISSSKISIPALQQIIVPISKLIPFHLRWRQLLSIPGHVKKLKPDIVIELAHFGPFNLPKHIKRITVIHDLSAISHRKFHSLASHIVQKISLPGILKKTDQIISNSNFTKQEIINRYQISESKIQVLYPRTSSYKTTTSSSFDFPFKDELYFLCVGTIEPRKNYETVIQAFEKVHDNNPKMNLVIVGMTGWKHNSVDTMLKQSRAKNQIHLTGYVTESQLSHLYSKAFAFISASHFEGFGLPILEAAAQSLPLIVADNSSQKEIVSGHGLLFPATNIEELKTRMESIIHSNETIEELKVKSKELVLFIEQQREEQLESLDL